MFSHHIIPSKNFQEMQEENVEKFNYFQRETYIEIA